MPSQHPPLRIADHNNRDPAGGQILLIAQIFVGCDENFKGCGLSRIEQNAVRQALPAQFLRENDTMAREMTAQWRWRALVKEDEHQPK